MSEYDMPLLSVQDLQKAYPLPAGEALPVLQGLSMQVAAGEFVSVVGESGSGKSTLLQIIGTLDRADAGSVHLAGKSILDLDSKAQARLRNTSIGFVYQAHHLIPELSALENVMLPLLIRGVHDRDAKERAKTLLTTLGLQARASHYPGKLSGGEAQRVAVARALITKPLLLLADEPTGNLDEETAASVFAEMKALCQEECAAVVIVTHSMALARACDHSFRLHAGVLHECVADEPAVAQS